MLRLGKLVTNGRVGDARIYNREVVVDELGLIRRMAWEKWLVRETRCWDRSGEAYHIISNEGG